MKRTRVIALTVGMLAAATAACSVITGLDADYTRQDEIQTGPDATADEDASGVSTDGNVPTDTSPADAGFAGEFCEQFDGSPNVAFCWDFSNSGEVPGAGFNGGSVSAGVGKLSISPDGGMNGSPCLVATLQHPTSSSQAYVEKSIGDDGGESFTTYKQHDLQFRFAVFQNDRMNFTTLGSLGFRTCKTCQPTVTGVANWLQEGQDRIDISAPPGSIGLPYAVAADKQWLRAEVKLTHASDGMPYTMEISVFDANNKGGVVETGTFAADAGSTELLFGTYFSSYAADAGSITVGIDDIIYSHVR